MFCEATPNDNFTQDNAYVLFEGPHLCHDCSFYLKLGMYHTKHCTKDLLDLEKVE